MRPDLSKMTSANIHDFVKENPYKFYGKPSKEINNLGITTVPFVDIFFGLCDGSSTPPTQEQFIDGYLKRCKEEIEKRDLNGDEYAKRLARNWSSLIMELDFVCQMRDSGIFDRVIMDTVLDAEKGRNVIVIYRGREWYVHLYFQTEYAEKWLGDKARRKAGLPKPLRFPLERWRAEKIGSVHFYKPEHVEELKQRFDKILSEE